MSAEEATPLLEGNESQGDGRPKTESVAVIDETPPPSYLSVTGMVPTVTCRVCQSSIDLSGKRDQHVVKCSQCKEATPIRNAPQGRKYVRCECNCLLVCRTSSQRISCPRPNCRKVINLSPAGPPPVPTVPGMSLLQCAHCNDTFTYNVLVNVMARCPHCRKLSATGNDARRKRGLVYFILSFMFLIVAIGVTVGTAAQSSSKAGLYVLYIGLFAATFVLFLRGVYFVTMKISYVTYASP